MENAIQMKNITKTFGSKVIANKNVTMDIHKGEILSLLGENGSGKTTQMNMIAGIYYPDSGEIYVNGKLAEIRSPKDAYDLGIGMIHQHFKLIDVFSATENIALGLEKTHKFDMKAIQKRAQEICDKYHFDLNLNQKVYEMSVSQKQTLEIVKALYRGADILILDEPTAVLTPQETERLFDVIRNMRNDNKSVIIITHKLHEVLEISDRVSILRKGEYVGTVNTNETTMEQLSAMMVGRNVNFHVEKEEKEAGEVILEVKDISVASKTKGNDAVNHVSFNVRAGEIVCIAGIDGNGQTELVYGITGLEPLSNGSLIYKGEDITKQSIRYRSVHGMSHIPEDRHKHGLVLDYSLEYNLVLQRYFESQFTTKYGFLKRKEIREYSDGLIEEHDIRSGQGSITVARSMSGGNQQKAIIAREIDRDPDLLIAVQPTRGVDVGAIEAIHKQLIEQRDQGKAVLLVSLELDEVMDVPDRILVMFEGEIVGELDPKKTTQEDLGLYMAGAKKDEVKSV